MEYVRGYFSIAVGILILCFTLLVNANLAFSQSSSITIFGPKQYDKPKGKPVTYTDTFQTIFPIATYTIWVQSGAEGLNEVKNVSVSINGVEIIDSRDLRTINPASKVISIQSTNTLTVTLKGQGGNYITVKILCEGCYPSTTGIISPQGGTVTLEGYATVIFPAGAFATNQYVTVSATASPRTKEDFEDIIPEPHLPYEIRINSGYIAPETSFDVIVHVPDSFIVPNSEVHIFAQIYEPPEVPEIYDHFQGFLTTFDSLTKTVRAALPKIAFTNHRGTGGTYEAIIMVSTWRINL